MASSSSSSMATAQPSFNYDVFVSFRGADTRLTLIGYVYKSLKLAGIRTYMDDEDLTRGKLKKPELEKEKAIQESAISLIIFSENYASSKWCLDELLMIIKNHETSSYKHEVIPVFYHVDPFDVRRQRGRFRDAFDVYEDEIKAESDLEKKTELREKVGAWRDSLEKAANLTGLVYKDGSDLGFIKRIVNVIRKKLDYKTAYIEEKIVGMKDDVAEIESWLQDPSPNATFLLIYGMGGIGKTTIAKYIYNSNFHNYDGHCFLANINEMSNQPKGMCRLQSQLLSTILKSDKEETVWNHYEGTVKVTNAISNKKVLLILDDVATSEQLDALLGTQKSFPGSKVMITTRTTELLTAFKVQPKVHFLRTLSTDDAVQLFSLYAFYQDKPSEPYTTLSQQLAQYCSGLPLSLKVLGSSLCGEKEKVWNDTLIKLAAMPLPEIPKVPQFDMKTDKETEGSED